MKLLGGKGRKESKTNRIESEKQKFCRLAIGAADELIDLFNDAVNKSFKGDISDALHHERVAKLLLEVDLDSQLSVENCHRVFKRCYGWKTWLYAPEDGIRGMIREGITAYYAPLQNILQDVHGLTQSAFELSLEEAKILQTPGNEALKQLMEEQAVESIEAWRTSTWQQLSANLHAEHEFPAPERFRGLKSSIDRLLEHEANVQAERLVEHYRNMIEVAMKRVSLSDLRKRELTSHALPGEAAKAIPQPTPVGEFYMGWLEKKNRFGKWQRRWVVLSPEKQRLYYFAHPEENPARGAASLVGCHVFPEVFEDGVFDDMSFKLVFRPEPGQQPSKLGELPLSFGKTKTTVTLTLRASSAGTKAEWLDMIGKAILGESGRHKHAQRGVNLVADSTSNAARKISSQVFDEEELPIEEHAKERRRPKRRSKSIVSFSIRAGTDIEEADDEIDGEASEAAKGDIKDDLDRPIDGAMISEETLADELALFDEVVAQAEQAVPSAEEAIMLECIAQAVRDYMIDSQRLIVEQASKIIKDGMLPFKHARELHADLLKAVLAE